MRRLRSLRIQSKATKQSAPTSSAETVCLPTRKGLTLLEVLVAVTIFFGSLTAILQLLATGQQAELMTRLQTEAVMRCESVMAEVVSGVKELKSADAQPFTDHDGTGTWQWTLEVASTETANLLQVTVTVEYVLSKDDIPATYTLRRYLRDPQIFLDAAATEETP
jgi:general secretion pathway protein I